MSELRCEGRGYFPWHGDGCGDETPCPGCEDCEPLQCPACLGYIRSSKKPKSTCVDGKPTKPVDVAKVDVEKLLFEIHQWCNRAYVKEDQYQSIRERIVLLAKERDEAVKVEGEPWQEHYQTAFEEWIFANKRADKAVGKLEGAENILAQVWSSKNDYKILAEKAERERDALQREIVELEKDKDTLMTALDGYKEATDDPQAD